MEKNLIVLGNLHFGDFTWTTPMGQHSKNRRSVCLPKTLVAATRRDAAASNAAPTVSDANSNAAGIKAVIQQEPYVKLQCRYQAVEFLTAGSRPWSSRVRCEHAARKRCADGKAAVSSRWPGS